jgi:hypothetical protein
LLDVYILEGKSLCVGRIRGTLHFRTATRLVELVELKKGEVERGFNRICDLTRSEGIQLTKKDVEALAARRRIHNPNQVPVKSAFIATEPLARTIASLYQTLVASERITVGVFDSFEAAPS